MDKPLLDDPPQFKGELAPQPIGELSIFERLARDPNVSVENLERLVALWERTEARKAEAAFNADMTAAQMEMKPVLADEENTQTGSKYPSFEALDKAVRPIYTAHGFGLSFNQGDGAPDLYVRVVCYVSHRGGHTRTYHADMPADGKGAKGGDVMTKTHAVGSAFTYGQRYLLKMIFNVAVAKDDDGNKAGQEAPPAPEGYDAWLATLEAVAENGMAAYSDAWNKSKKEFRTYLGKTAPKHQAALKTRAEKAKREEPRGGYQPTDDGPRGRPPEGGTAVVSPKK